MRHGGASCPGSIRLVASVLDLSPQVTAALLFNSFSLIRFLLHRSCFDILSSPRFVDFSLLFFNLYLGLLDLLMRELFCYGNLSYLEFESKTVLKVQAFTTLYRFLSLISVPNTVMSDCFFTVLIQDI